jgi:transposase InsO family protein
MRIAELDSRFRSTWDVRTIAHVVNLGHETVAKVLREVRGPRPKRAKPPHVRKTRFLKTNVMWSMDFKELPGKRCLIHTIDEASGYRLGWKVCQTPTAEAALEHMKEVIQNTGKVPLVWKFDHGPAFMSRVLQTFLSQNEVLPYPIPPRAPWVQGRIERDHLEIQNWLNPVEKQDLSWEALEQEIQEGMLMLNFVKPRATLGFRTAAEVYHNLDGFEEEKRESFRRRVEQLKFQLGPKGGERLHRKAVRAALQEFGLYQEWLDSPSEAETVNTSQLVKVAV